MKKQAVLIVKKLQDLGFKTYFAGGGVRDFLLGNDPKDIDIVSSAKPEQVEEIFDTTIPVGKEFGIIIVREGDYNFEIATFREEGPYKDNRRPDWVKFSGEEEDAKRRDFTINGMFYDPIKNQVIDYVGGQEDLKKHIIRFIGDPEQRIKEDNLRLIRAIRFKVNLNFQYAKETFEIVTKLSSLIKNVAPERIKGELNKIFSTQRRHIGLTELAQSRITDHILPEINALKGVPQPIEYHHEGDVFTHTYLAVKSLPEDAPLHLVWAVLLHDIAKPDTLIREGDRIIFHNHAEVSSEKAKTILKRLKFSNIEISTICWLIENHMKIAVSDKMRPTKRLAFLLDHRFPDLIELLKADSNGTYPINLSLADRLKEDLAKAEEEKKRLRNAKSLTKLFTGDNLIKLGYNPSKEFKGILDEVNDLILDKKITSTAQAEDFVKKNYEN